MSIYNIQITLEKIPAGKFRIPWRNLYLQLQVPFVGLEYFNWLFNIFYKKLNKT